MKQNEDLEQKQVVEQNKEQDKEQNRSRMKNKIGVG